MSFNLQDFAGLAWDTGTVPELTFRASSPGVSPFAAHAGEVTVSPQSDGNVTVDLVPTVGMYGNVSYGMELSWIEGGRSRRQFWDYRIRVPESGDLVPLMDLVDAKQHELYQQIEFSAGTQDFEGGKWPHSANTDIWFRDTGDRYVYMIWSD